MANTTEMTNEARELSDNELELVSGGINFGPVHIDYSEGSGAIDIGVGDMGVYFGPNGAGWYNGSSYGQWVF